MYSPFFLVVGALSIKCVHSEDVLIIGAGASGIAAAARLLEFNVTDIKVLEAENRIGGRINSVFVSNGYVDLGGEVVTLEKGNIVDILAGDVLKTRNVSKEVYHSDGEKVVDEFAREILDISKFLNPSAYNDTSAVSIGDVLQKGYSSDILYKYRNDPKKFKLAGEFLNVLLGLVFSPEASFAGYLSLFRPHCKDCRKLTWDGKGYKTILEILIEKYKNKETNQSIDGKIILNKTVTKISWNGSNGVYVECLDGTYYSAKHVIFTPSIGVLKANHKIFEPEYPKQKIEALSCLGDSLVMKIIFHFPNNWWNGTTYFIFLHSEEEKAISANIFKDGPSSNGTSWVSSFQHMLEAPNNPNVMIGWLTGPLVPEVENLSEELIRNGTMYIMKKFLGKQYNISEPLDIIYSRWFNNPHFLGTFSIERVNSLHSKRSPHLIIQQPLLDTNGTARVLFAGEATVIERCSTVPGAIESGHREADRIIKLYKQ